MLTKYKIRYVDKGKWLLTLQRKLKKSPEGDIVKKQYRYVRLFVFSISFQ